MAVCTQCGASTSAKRCPRCGGETSPYAAPRPEAERGPAVTPPAGTTVALPRLDAPSFAGSPFPDLPSVASTTGTNPQAPSAAADWPPPSPPLPPRPVGAAAAPAAPAAPRSGSTAPVVAPSPLTGRGAAFLAAAIVVMVAVALVLLLLQQREARITPVSRPAVTQSVVSLPIGAVACSEEDAPRGRQVYVGNTATTCAFAQNVKAALGAKSGRVTLEAYSPKAGRSYEMTCTGDPNITCTGANGAVVYLVPEGAKAVIRDH